MFVVVYIDDVVVRGVFVVGSVVLDGGIEVDVDNGIVVVCCVCVVECSVVECSVVGVGEVKNINSRASVNSVCVCKGYSMIYTR